MPEVEVWGEDLFSLRRRLLSDPRLQRPRVTAEAEARTALVKAQLTRERLRASAADEAAFLASLEIQCRIEKLASGAALERIEELFQRTTQFNATGRKFSRGELAAIAGSPRGAVFAMQVKDRLADHGLVAACVAMDGEIAGFAMSCRVIGLGVEHRFLREILADLAASHREVVARIVETSRNGPARNLYRDGGFAQRADGAWVKRLHGAAATAA